MTTLSKAAGPLALLSAACLAQAASFAPEEMAEARRFVAARFVGSNLAGRIEPALVVLANHGPVQRNARGVRPLRLGDREFNRGLYCHAPSKVLVRLPGPGATFTALAGVDTNDQTSGGRGSVDFSVHVSGTEQFRSGVTREGMPARPVSVPLAGATELELRVEETADGIACDQADWAEARVTLRDGRILWLGDLPLVEERAQRLFSNEPPFSFTLGGKPSSEFLEKWKVERREQAARDVPPSAGARGYEVTWTDPQTGLQVRCVAIAYGDFPTVEWTLHFKNTGAADTPILSDIQALDLHADRPPAGEFVLHHHKGDDNTPDSYGPRELTLATGSEHHFVPPGGKPTEVAFPFFNLEWAGRGLIAVVAWPGRWEARFTRDTTTGVHVRAGQASTRFLLHPGEEVRTPLIVLQFWETLPKSPGGATQAVGDRTRAQNIWRRWMLAHNAPRMPDGQLPAPIFTSCSGGFFPGLQCNETDELRFIDAFVQAGVRLDYWWMDAGWYPCGEGWPNVGTWTPDAKRFPNGLRAVSDHAHAKGMGLIVWFEPERVTPGTWLYTNQPAWLLGQAGGTKLLNLGHPEARAWLVEHVSRTIREQGIDFYRQDFNMNPLPYWQANDTADRQGITEIRHVEGYLAYWDELRRRHPALRIDSCAGGGRRNDLETLRRAVPLLRSDYQSFSGDPAFAPGNQGHTFGMSSWIPYFGQGVYYSDRQFVYSARSYLSPAMGSGVDVRQPGVDWALLRRVVEQWRRVAPSYLGDFYPLTPYRLDGDVWMAWQFDLPEKGQGMVQAFRREGSAYEAARFPLHGLEATARYSVTNFDESEPHEFTGRELLENGLTISLRERPAAALIAYQRLR